MRVFFIPLAAVCISAVLIACGGGSGSSSPSSTTAGSTTTNNAGTAAISIVDPVAVNLPDGAPLPAMSDALIVGDRIVVRSRSDAYVTVNHLPVYASTRLSVLDKQGKLLATTDYGFSLAAGYTGQWLMMPSPDGFIMLQASGATRLLHFDAQAGLTGEAAELYPTTTSTSATELAPAENGGAVDGNGFWLATTFSSLPVTDKTQYLLKLCKFDFNGKQLTPPFAISNSALHPRVAAAAGTVLAGWLEGGGAMLAMWPRGAGTPVIRSLGTGGSQPYPVALNADGKMGVLWNGKATTTSSGGVMGVTLDSSGAALLPAGRTDLTQESLSSHWNGNARVSDIDAHAFGNGLAIAGSVVGSFNPGDAVGDVLVLADYGVGTGALSAQQQDVLRFTLPGRAALGPTPIFRQMLFADHAVLLIGDDTRLQAIYTTHNH